MTTLTFYKVVELPSTYTPNAAYMVSEPDADHFSLYISSVDGSAIRHVANAVPASTSIAGIVQLSSAVDSESTAMAATPSAVKQAYDLASQALAASEKTSNDYIEPFLLMGV